MKPASVFDSRGTALLISLPLLAVVAVGVGLRVAVHADPNIKTLGSQGSAPGSEALAPSGSAPAADAVDPKLYQDLKWRSVGPHRGGRVTAVAGIRTQPGTFYMGGAGGGVWKTDNYGLLWTPVTDGQIAVGSIGAIDVSDSNPNIVYVGTGSACIRSNVSVGKGVYKSTDAGKTWTFIGLKDVGQIGAVRIHPTNPDVAYLAALGSPFGPNSERGVFRTQDGGRTWQNVLFVNERVGAVSLAMNYSKPSEIYAGVWRGERKPWTIISGGPASEGGIYKTADGGDTWTRVTDGLPKNLIGKTNVAVAQSNPRIVYALVEAPGTEGGVYRTDNAGATWVQTSSEWDLRERPFYYNHIDVNPKNENEVWVNSDGLFKSVDGGRTWQSVRVPHGDNHGMWFNPDNPSIAVQCNDGGANVTQDGGKSWSSILNQPTAEFYMVDVDNQFPYRLYAPQQDNSTVIVPSVPPVAWGLDDPTQVWLHGPGCETGQIHPRPDGQIVYGVCKGEFSRYSVETGQQKNYWIYPQNRYGHNPKDMKYRFQRQSPVEVSPHDPNVVYHGSQYLHRTTDEGVTWQTISPDLTANEPDKQVISGEPITRDITGEEVYSTLYAIEESRLEKGVIWVGSNDGPVHVTRDGGKTWKNVTPKDLPPGGRVQNIEDSPHRKGSAYVAVYRFLLNDWQPYIYLTDDYGATWTRLTDGKNGIPGDWPTRAVREDPDVEGLLYAGTEFGAFVSFDNGKHWQSLQQNLPATPVTDIRVHRKDLVISTMGRAFWIMDDITPLEQIAMGLKATTTTVPASNGSSVGAGFGRPASDGQKTASAVAQGFSPGIQAFLFEPRVSYRTRYSASGGSPDEPEYPPVGASVNYHFASAPAGEVKLEILDAAGRVIRTFSSEPRGRAPEGGGGRRAGGALSSTLPKKAGHNRFLWDLRYPGPWDPNNPEGGSGGPLVVPGKYQVHLTSGRFTQTRTIEVRIDPRVTADGVSQADLQAQLDLSLKVRDAISEARKLQQRLAQAMEKAGVKPPPAPGPGETAMGLRYAHPLQVLWARLVTASGPYPQPMLIDQVSNIARMIGGADQRPGKDALERYNDVTKELAAIQVEVDKLVGSR